ncbi:hypothetical protein ACS33_01840 [Edwardsiella ictaluri]|nr:hypothetical protein ACS33_01840 [Edwardsiella ictaluri]
MRRLFLKAGDAELLIDCHHAKGVGLFAGNLDTADSAACAGLHVIQQHLGIVHFINMVTSQDHHIFWSVMALHDLFILVYRIGSAAIPVSFLQLLAGWQQIDKFVAFGVQE